MYKHALIALAIIASSGSANGQATRTTFSYVTTLGPRDHFNSAGQRLETIGAIVRQDRANFHRGDGDVGDQDDPAFLDPDNRAVLEQVLDRTPVPAAVRRAIVDGQPKVLVFIRNGDITVGIIPSQ